jgi:hypothetical protein
VNPRGVDGATGLHTGWIRTAADNWQRFDYDYDERGQKS